MNKPDLTEMRQSQAWQRETSIPNTSKPLLPANVRRVALIISSDSVADIWISFGKPAAVGTGLLQAAKAVPLALSIDQYGALVMGDLFAIASAGTALVSVWEVSLPL